MVRLLKIKFCITIVIMLFCSTCIFCQNEQPEKSPFTKDLSSENRAALRKEILAQLILRYAEDQTFFHIHQYMVVKYKELKIHGSPREADILIKETFDKVQGLYNATQPFVKNSLNKVYEPILIEKSINKYLWLKGLCFVVMGINKEHEIGLSYFYLPENEQQKRALLRKIVQYSYPEVPDIAENDAWYESMTDVMERVGYRAFEIKKFCPLENNLTPQGGEKETPEL